MAQPKITVLFYSTYGTNHKVALKAVEAAEAAGAEVRLRKIRETAPQEVIDGQDAWKAQQEQMADIPEASLDDMEWADGFFISAPTRFGVVASQVRSFIDTMGSLWQSGKLVNKTLTATTSTQTQHGGQETTFLSLYLTAMHWGCLIVTPAYADSIKFEDGGNPYGFSMAMGEWGETGEKSVAFQATRLVEVTKKIIG
ncbi:NAD(P)H-dependent oxidoreductase [Palleronia sp.]|uniref:NAD(P)H-dependent oxidoreductase n=1 Tax=Palleronia sp. TaxID=1940284 RepID=UPI0035C7BE75